MKSCVVAAILLLAGPAFAQTPDEITSLLQAYVRIDTSNPPGDTRKAAECYGFVMAAWRRPDPELLPYVAEAREGLARLRVE